MSPSSIGTEGDLLWCTFSHAHWFGESDVHPQSIRVYTKNTTVVSRGTLPTARFVVSVNAIFCSFFERTMIAFAATLRHCLLSLSSCHSLPSQRVDDDFFLPNNEFILSKRRIQQRSLETYPAPFLFCFAVCL